MEPIEAIVPIVPEESIEPIVPEKPYYAQYLYNTTVSD